MSARDDLIREIEAFLFERENVKRPLDRWECEHLISAIADIPNVPEQGLLAIEKAQRPPELRSPQEMANLRTAYDILTLAEARANFEKFKARRPY
jgi:hypothetical protein